MSVNITLEYKRKYRELRNLVIWNLKEKYLKEKCKDIEVKMKMDSRDITYKSVKNYKPKIGATEDNNEAIIYENKHRGNI